ncbi:MAG: hypothetical protein ABI706_19630 [Ilumatobacteraceae bacterium]
MNRTHLAVAGLLLATVASCSSVGSKADAPAEFCVAANAAKDAADAQQQLFNLALSPVPADVQPAVEGFAAKFAAMSALAPAEIKADVGTINTAAQQLLTVVKANNYDVTAMVTTPEFATLTDTFASADYTDAQNRFQNYVGVTCGITATTDPAGTSDLNTTTGS